MTDDNSNIIITAKNNNTKKNNKKNKNNTNNNTNETNNDTNNNNNNNNNNNTNNSGTKRNRNTNISVNSNNNDDDDDSHSSDDSDFIDDDYDDDEDKNKSKRSSDEENGANDLIRLNPYNNNPIENLLNLLIPPDHDLLIPQDDDDDDYCSCDDCSCPDCLDQVKNNDVGDDFNVGDDFMKIIFLVNDNKRIIQSPPSTKKNKPVNKQPTKKRKTKPIITTKVSITEEIKSIDDLINLPDKYEDRPELEYPFQMATIKKLIPALLELKSLVGLDDIKSQILDQILFLLSNLNDPDQMLHTVIYGSPGSGKTVTGTILSKIYAALGFSNGSFKIVKRADLVAGYLGQTAIKTQKVIDEVIGGVLFIDEAYALGSDEGRDSFSKECVDTLNANLTEHSTKFICIIAGYKDELDNCFFSQNPGLNRRFPFRYHIKEYDSPQLSAIFHTKVKHSNWTVDPIPNEFFDSNFKYFIFKGGDMELLSQMSKIAYSRRTFGKHQEINHHLTYIDVKNGMDLFLLNDEVKNRSNNNNLPDMVQNMYI
jgi:ATPase family associated with various cellular activities (AAA)